MDADDRGSTQMRLKAISHHLRSSAFRLRPGLAPTPGPSAFWGGEGFSPLSRYQERRPVDLPRVETWAASAHNEAIPAGESEGDDGADLRRADSVRGPLR